jgi:hypothetical protein
MTGGETTIVVGIEIPSTDPVFLAVVLGVHIPLGLACCDRRNRDVESKASRASFQVWNYLLLVSVGAQRFRDVPVAYALGRELSLVHSRSDVVRLRLVRALSAPASLAVLGQASYRGDGLVVHPDAGCFLRRQWKAATALEGPASFHVLADTYGRRHTAHRSRAAVAAVGAAARRDFHLICAPRIFRYRIHGLAALPASIQNIKHWAVGGSALRALSDSFRQDSFELDEVGELTTNAGQMGARYLMHVGARRAFWPS